MLRLGIRFPLLWVLLLLLQLPLFALCAAYGAAADVFEGIYAERKEEGVQGQQSRAAATTDSRQPSRLLLLGASEIVQQL